MITKSAVVAGEVDLGARLTEVVGAGGEISGPNAVEQRYAFRAATRRLAAVTARAEQLTDVSQERRLANAAGDQGDLFRAGGVGKAVAKRSPDFDAIAGPQMRHQARYLADYEVDDIDGIRLILR